MLAFKLPKHIKSKEENIDKERDNNILLKRKYVQLLAMDRQSKHHSALNQAAHRKWHQDLAI